MGYTKIVQYGNTTEIYEYEREYRLQVRTRTLSRLERKRRSEARLQAISRGQVQKSKYALRRAKTNFFRLVSETLHQRGKPLFITLTVNGEHISVPKAYQYLAQFKTKVENKMGTTVTYIAVPEFQKKSGRIHLHVLAWGIPNPTIIETTERNTRNLQRLYRRGFLDVRFAYDNSPKLASYLAKYMQKANADRRLSGKKAYTTSRGINRPRIQGSNTLSEYLRLYGPESEYSLKPDEKDIDHEQIRTYDTEYLGKCKLTIIKTKKNEPKN